MISKGEHILYHEKIRIPATLEELHHVYSWAEAHLRQSGIAESKRFDIMLALSEAVTNAIRHGCHGSHGDFVDIEVTITDHAVNIRVHDCGTGFEPEKLPDPTTDENIYVPSGRGVFLIKSLADDVRFDFSDNGTTVSVKFAL
ncbi:MAG: ATP-binding protein [Bacteroidota bacterium]|nr:ATP-binding protein [Bacteroidota bacterium]